MLPHHEEFTRPGPDRLFTTLPTYNFNLAHGPTHQNVHLLRNNVSLNGVNQMLVTAIQISNSWQVLPSVGTNDFLSVDAAFASCRGRTTAACLKPRFCAHCRTVR
jgi:hypothetical protein